MPPTEATPLSRSGAVTGATVLQPGVHAGVGVFVRVGVIVQVGQEVGVVVGVRVFVGVPHCATVNAKRAPLVRPVLHCTCVNALAPSWTPVVALTPPWPSVPMMMSKAFVVS